MDNVVIDEQESNVVLVGCLQHISDAMRYDGYWSVVGALFKLKTTLSDLGLAMEIGE
jgi:hypothetical protein